MINRSRTFLGLAGAMILAAVLTAPDIAQAQRAAAGPPDWPCVQRLIPDLAWSAMWTGPSIDELDRPWWSDPEVGRTVRLAGSRATPHDEAISTVRAFVGEIGDDNREERLTLLFSGLFENISRERTRIIEAILRYSRGQVDRLERLGEIVDDLEVARTDPHADAARDR